MRDGPRRYFDNAATSFPKPPEVIAAMSRYAAELGASPGRGAYREVRDTTAILDRCRDRLRRLLGGNDPSEFVFTLNTTDALHLAIDGVVLHHLERGESVHLITSDLDHNSVLRPFRALAERHAAVTCTHVACDPASGRVDPLDVRAALQPDTRLVALVHASNASGTIQPIEAVGAICREANVPFLVDAAQTVGHRPIDLLGAHVDLCAFPGHKGLLGPLGTGVLWIRDGIESRLANVRVGGTGSLSERDVQPDAMPERFESGSHNAIGIVGLDASLAWIEARTIESIAAHEHALTTRMLDGLAALDGWRLLGPTRAEERVGVFSLVHDSLAPNAVADRLERSFGILARAGLHCAPFAHRTFGTDPDAAAASGRVPGALRLSIGPFLADGDVDAVLIALDSIHADAGTTACATGGAR